MIQVAEKIQVENYYMPNAAGQVPYQFLECPFRNDSNLNVWFNWLGLREEYGYELFYEQLMESLLEERKWWHISEAVFQAVIKTQGLFLSYFVYGGVRKADEFLIVGVRREGKNLVFYKIVRWGKNLKSFPAIKRHLLKEKRNARLINIGGTLLGFTFVALAVLVFSKWKGEFIVFTKIPRFFSGRLF